MNPKRKKRILIILTLLIILTIAFGLILYALKQNINLFYTPTELSKTTTVKNQILRIGGYVKKHSVHYDKKNQSISFVITDYRSDVTVHYSGILPNLFREGQGVVVTGQLSDLHFHATQVLAKHDENYIPLPLAKTLKKEAQCDT